MGSRPAPQSTAPPGHAARSDDGGRNGRGSLPSRVRGGGSGTWRSASRRPGRKHHLKALETQLAEYFAGARRDFDLPLALAGTDFQQRVWRQLQRVPFGETITYDELAQRAGSPGASRAAGQANGSNPVAIVVPCHRVIRASGETGGYAGGPDRKRRLLELEAPSAQGSLFSPP